MHGNILGGQKVSAWCTKYYVVLATVTSLQDVYDVVPRTWQELHGCVPVGPLPLPFLRSCARPRQNCIIYFLGCSPVTFTVYLSAHMHIARISSGLHLPAASPSGRK